MCTVPRLIDEKRKNLEKGLSARQRDQLLFKESKDDAAFRKELCESIRQSNEQFADAMKSMSNSFVQVAESMKMSLDALSNLSRNTNVVTPPVTYNHQGFAVNRATPNFVHNFDSSQQLSFTSMINDPDRVI